MSTLSPNDYIKSIICYLKDESKIPESKISEEKMELELDLLSENLFENLYHNLLFYYKLYQKQNIQTEEQKYFFTEIVNILEFIYDSSPTTLIYNDHVKAALIYIINSLKAPIILNPEIVMKIFLGFKNIFSYITNEIIENELSNFELEIIEIIKKINERYYMDFNDELDIAKKKNLKEIIAYLNVFQYNLPLYFKGFIKYNRQTNGIKYIALKVFKYFMKITPYTEDKFIYLYQGYLLYGILSYDNIQQIDFQKFKDIQTKRIKNEEAKDILLLAIKFLKEKNFSNFFTKLEKENLYFYPDASKVLDIFDETDKYYKELYNQIKYYLSQYKQKIKLECEIYKKNNSRILWLNFIKLLLLNLSETDICNNNIKILFYFIVNLFSPEINSSALEFREDVIPKLFYQSIWSTEILFFGQFYQIIDKDYFKYYPISEKINNFEQEFINMIDKYLISILKNSINELPTGPKQEIKNIQKFMINLPFPLLQDYLSINNINFYKNPCLPPNLYSFYKSCFYDLEEDEKKSFIANIRNIENPINLIGEDDIQKVINNNSFIILIKDIMKSPVMKDAYTRIFYYYSKNGEFDLNQENFDQKSFESEKDYINNKSIFDYYKEFCETLNNLNYSKLFIIMSLPATIKAFTFRFLKIVINSEGVKLKIEKETDNDVSFLLLKAYLVFIIIQQLNDFMKIYLNKNQAYDLCKTSIGKDSKEGGEQLIKLLFGHILKENTLNVEQAKYILEIKNWNKNSVIQFKRDFLNIKKDSKSDNCIVYLSSKMESICDHSKLNG